MELNDLKDKIWNKRYDILFTALRYKIQVNTGKEIKRGITYPLKQNIWDDGRTLLYLTLATELDP